VTSEVKNLLGDLAESPLRESLRRAQILAQRSEKPDFAAWCQLELDGYSSFVSSNTRDTVVPVYRTVKGQHTDVTGTPLVVSSGQTFFEVRLSNGVEELEILPASGDTVAIHDPQMCDLVKQEHNVEVYWYRFSTLQLFSIFSAIRVALWTKLSELDPVEMPQALLIAREDVMESIPNIDLFGFNLRAFWRRWKGTSKA
jgi:hypothetical protein